MPPILNIEDKLKYDAKAIKSYTIPELIQLHGIIEMEIEARRFNDPGKADLPVNKFNRDEITVAELVDGCHPERSGMYLTQKAGNRVTLEYINTNNPSLRLEEPYY